MLSDCDCHVNKYKETKTISMFKAFRYRELYKHPGVIGYSLM